MFGVALVGMAGFVVYKMDEANVKALSMQKASRMFSEREASFKYYIRDITLKISALNNSSVFQEYLQGLKTQEDVDHLFLTVATTSENIMQLRFIDTTGQERIRVDRVAYGSSPSFQDEKNLQNKHNRYYFEEIISMDKQEFWYSKIDLNVEHGVIEKPIKPVLRVGTPVFIEGKKVGILIINIFMKKFLHRINKSVNYNIFLVDKDGYILMEPDHKGCWNRYLKKDIEPTHYFGSELQEILAHNEYTGSTLYSKKIFLNNGEEIRLILQLEDDTLKDLSSKSLQELFFIFLGILVFSFPMAYFFSRKPVQLQDELTKHSREQNILLSLFDLGDEVLFKWNNDEHWSVASVSVSVEKLLGYSKEAFEMQKVIYAECIHQDDLAKVIEEVTYAIEHDEYYFSHEPYRVITKKGDIKWILDNTVIVKDEQGKVISFVGYLSDITELKSKEFELQRLSQTDKLTQLYNRVYIDDILQAQFSRFKRYAERCSIVMLDIDHFKEVNDAYGHVIGDSVLIEFAQLLRGTVRLGDVAGRWGGEEFLIILPHTDLAEAMIVAEKLRRTIEYHHFAHVRHKTASFGVVTFKGKKELEEFIDLADKALYSSKKHGRNCVSKGN
jgi:diguanylate cyclase (GGDEF)-like protein/PAS domain S-box-containing protein